jgi:hypothetical protein
LAAGFDDVTNTHGDEPVFPGAATDVLWFFDLIEGTGQAALLRPLVRKALAIATVDIADAQGREMRAQQKLLDDERRASEKKERRLRAQLDREHAEQEERAAREREARINWIESGDELHLYWVDLTSNRPWDARDGDWRVEAMTRLSERHGNPIVHSYRLGVVDGNEGLVREEEALAGWIRFPEKRRRYVRVPSLDRIVQILNQDLHAVRGRRALVVILHPEVRGSSSDWSLRPLIWNAFRVECSDVSGILHLWPCAALRVSVRQLEIRAGARAPFGLSQSGWRASRKSIPSLVNAFVDAANP